MLYDTPLSGITISFVQLFIQKYLILTNYSEVRYNNKIMAKFK